MVIIIARKLAGIILMILIDVAVNAISDKVKRKKRWF